MFYHPRVRSRESVARSRRGLILLSFLAAACSGAPPAGDVLLITVDTLRPDHLGLYGYPRNTSPNLVRWFGDAAVFERAYATAANTTPSVASLLAGLHPQHTRTPRVSNVTFR